jgi:hypothetical protein
MKYKALTSAILSVVAIIGGIYLNFHQFLMGSPANIKNLIVTIVYVIIWIISLNIGSESKNCRVMKYFYIFWIATLIISVITAYVNMTEVYAGWAIPFAILLLTQWYGINFFINNFVTIAIIIAVLSFMAAARIKLMLKDKNQ